MRILISSSMKVFDRLEKVASDLRKQGYEVEIPEKGASELASKNPIHFKREMIDAHMEKLRNCDVLMLANIGGRIGVSTFFEAGWAFALAKPIFILEKIDRDSDFAEDLLAIGAIEIDNDLAKIKENL